MCIMVRSNLLANVLQGWAFFGFYFAYARQRVEP
jgi:hypothetical protein